MTFLLADDNPRMLASMKHFLLTGIPGQHTIFEASDGEQAMELYERLRPDWVLMDIMMEPVDGLTATRKITAVHPDAKIIIVTNFDDEKYRHAAKEAGARGFVLKEHLEQIRTVLDEK
jgi:two-component system, NarL family, response regulator LiaR